MKNLEKSIFAFSTFTLFFSHFLLTKACSFELIKPYYHLHYIVCSESSISKDIHRLRKQVVGAWCQIWKVRWMKCFNRFFVWGAKWRRAPSSLNKPWCFLFIGKRSFVGIWRIYMFIVTFCNRWEPATQLYCPKTFSANSSTLAFWERFRLLFSRPCSSNNSSNFGPTRFNTGCSNNLVQNNAPIFPNDLLNCIDNCLIIRNRFSARRAYLFSFLRTLLATVGSL